MLLLRKNMKYGAMVALIGFLSACQFTPVYQKGGLASELSAIAVETPDSRDGQLLRIALEDTLLIDDQNRYSVRYRLEPTLNINLEALSIESDGTTRRHRLIGRSEINLYDKSSGRKLYYDVVERLNSYNISDDDYSTFIAGRDARRQVIEALAEETRLRLIAYFNKGA